MKKLILLTAALVLFVGAAFATSVSFNSGWEFSQDQKVWQAVDLPHDWAIGSDFDPVAHESGSGA